MQATLYFKQEHFKTSIPVAITAMLVMYTLNQSISSKLPQTSIIRFIDIWIMYGHCQHFLILVLLILIEHLPDNARVSYDSEGRKYKSPKAVTQMFARQVLPIIETVFVIAYFSAAFIIHNKV